MSSDIWTTILVQPLRLPCCSLFSLIKNNRERKRKRENKNIIWVWKKKLYKSCIKMVVQILFLINYLPLTCTYFCKKKKKKTYTYNKAIFWGAWKTKLCPNVNRGPKPLNYNNPSWYFLEDNASWYVFF